MKLDENLSLKPKNKTYKFILPLNKVVLKRGVYDTKLDRIHSVSLGAVTCGQTDGHDQINRCTRDTSCPKRNSNARPRFLSGSRPYET
jgi:hypothetical protein